MKLPQNQNNYLKISNKNYQKFVINFFDQELDNEAKDLTSNFIFNDHKICSKAEIIAKEEGILSGREEIEFYLKKRKIKQNWLKKDGQKFLKNEKILYLQGEAKELLKMERVLLNFISRMSGISSKTFQINKKFPKNIYLASTRKTLWGLLDKKAVSIGGGLTHRLNLSDAVLIKENHLKFLNIKDVCQKISLASSKEIGKFWEIEVENKKQFLEVLKNLPSKRPGVIMLDNFTPQKIKQILKLIQKPQNIFFEASGGINENNIMDFIKSGVDVISMGFLTKNVYSIDFSMYLKEV